jgi:hypothetical protein
LGVKSVEEVLREPTLSAAARALARPVLNGELLPGPVEDGEGAPDPLPADAAERVLGPIGTVRFCRFWVESLGRVIGRGINDGSGGASAAGMGSPRAAAMSWCSAQLSDQSFNPRQKGASLRSICPGRQPYEIQSLPKYLPEVVGRLACYNPPFPYMYRE